MRSTVARYPKAYLVLQRLGGVIVVALLAWAFGAIAEDVPEKGFMVNADARITDWLQVHGTETGEAIFATISWLGAPVLTAALVIAIVVFVRRRRWWPAAAVAVCGGGGALVNFGLKAIFHRGRPDFASEFIHGTSWSFPSGHAMDSLAGYGIIAFFLVRATADPRRRATIVALTGSLVLAIGFSRVYLGVHYLSDVVAGFLAGGIWLMLCIAGYRVALGRVIPLGDTT